MVETYRAVSMMIIRIQNSDAGSSRNDPIERRTTLIWNISICFIYISNMVGIYQAITMIILKIQNSDFGSSRIDPKLKIQNYQEHGLTFIGNISICFM